MTKVDWIPKSYEGLEMKLKQTFDYLNAGDNLQRMGLIGFVGWMNSTFQPKKQEYEEAVGAWRNPATRTPLIIKAVQDSYGEIVPLYRDLYSGMLRKNPLVSAIDLAAMGLPARPDSTPTPSPVPLTFPIAEVKLPSQGVIEFEYRDSESPKRGKPAGVHGAEIVWAIMDTTPTEWQQLTNSSFSTSTPFRLTFDGNQRGKRLYYAFRWENTRGIKGPWGSIQDTVIP